MMRVTPVGRDRRCDPGDERAHSTPHGDHSAPPPGEFHEHNRHTSGPVHLPAAAGRRCGAGFPSTADTLTCSLWRLRQVLHTLREVFARPKDPSKFETETTPNEPGREPSRSTGKRTRARQPARGGRVVPRSRSIAATSTRSRTSLDLAGDLGRAPCSLALMETSGHGIDDVLRCAVEGDRC
jgi:hypothetical protein